MMRFMLNWSNIIRTFTSSETSKIVNICIVNDCITGPLRIHRLFDCFYFEVDASILIQSVDQNLDLNFGQVENLICTK